MARGHGDLTPVALAARQGHERCLQSLLKAKEAQNWVRKLDDTKRNSVHWCCLEGHDGCLSQLLKFASSKTVSCADSDGLCPIIAASFSRSADMVFRLLATDGVSARASDLEGNTALHWASSHGEPTIVAALLGAAEPALVSAVNREGKCAVHAAVFSGQIACLEILLAASVADAMVPDKQGSTAMHMAAQNIEHGAACIEVMLGAGAPARTAVTVADKAGNLPIHLAAEVRSRPSPAL